jgi:nucleotide-binding universal stress UspA family protein
MIRDLLVHVDGSEAGRRRLRFAIDLALRTGARLNGLHVMPTPEVATPVQAKSGGRGDCQYVVEARFECAGSKKGV